MTIGIDFMERAQWIDVAVNAGVVIFVVPDGDVSKQRVQFTAGGDRYTITGYIN